MTYVPQVEPLSYREIEEISLRQLERHFPDLLLAPGPVDVIETWELLHDIYKFDTSVTSTLPHGVEGRTWPDHRVEVSDATYTLACRGDPRSRFTVIHECAHVWQHASQIRNVLESGSTLRLNRRDSIPTFRDPEWQANAITAAYMMPACALKILKKRRPLSARLLMQVFNVSYSAANVRLDVVNRKNLI
ncbi:ImmA/IrrE family metallo-endopeptidase [Aureliella helgolandensis]|uniref:IrrE N-terminal-like domain-containing protein n=1 Tax=Aureliella helgolandensis TaxID=2527968 RepID=A0A518G4C7_9BACT|nr:hypothetical protein Q31a_17400 [Aureliella helgolandensis]